ncbi:uncharacterized protein LOC128951548 [Oppia nitens]|uniref:uncharacterized protein LOC128951548 n=1 Tax=Oppia nitens TaxID=1686743 RepID=UPI0023DB9A9C|nr:uncharacterized protein LOC128951548 [Oppia nitens]
MAPLDYYRSEILSQLYGNNGGQQYPSSSSSSDNRADWCINIMTKSLKQNKLHTAGRQLVYIYTGRKIRVDPGHVIDKPKCIKNNFNTFTTQQQQQQQQYGNNNLLTTNKLPINSNNNFNMTNFIQIYTRPDQLFHNKYKLTYQDGQVSIVAPEWVELGLQQLSKFIGSTGLSCKLIDSQSNQRDYIIPGGHQLTLKQLVMLARNESGNTSGRINFQQYGSRLPREVILSIKDLARQCIIVGRNRTSHYGGYPRGTPRVLQSVKVYLVDLIGLQFQQSYNSGRLVTHGYRERGVLDDFIYEKIMGQPRPSIHDIQSDRTGRFVLVNGACFDILAYINFVANDVYLCGMAVDACAHELVNFKFVKYGTGFYAPEPYKAIVNRYINAGVSSGLNKLLDNSAVQKIASIELPFFDPTQDIIDSLVSHNRPAPVFGKQDALKQTNGYLTATTNCADGHCVTGNEMGFNSVDSAIAENLVDRANKFSPVLNELMTERYIQVPNTHMPRAGL